MVKRRTILILLGYLVACAAFVVAAGFMLRGCVNMNLGEFDGPSRPSGPSTTTTTNHIERALSCEEAQQLLIDAATRLELTVAGDQLITGASSMPEFEARLEAAVGEQLQQLEGIEVSPDCG
jgi:hypothetical protein